MEEFNEGVERVTAGLEKKQRVMNAEEKQRVAYHEAGHALVACVLPNTDPVHKVSIIPRGLAALGYTLQRPDGDRYLLTQAELESRIVVLLAGTVAEELVFGDISTGASNDLERASDIARSMVMDYGMSRLGRIAYRETSRSIFLMPGGDDRVMHHSQDTAREIDREVKRILEESLAKVREILASRRAALLAVAEELMVVESMDAPHLKQIIEENSPGPQVVPGTHGESRQRPQRPSTSAQPVEGENVERSG
jgi:cell division protease FtsH